MTVIAGVVAEYNPFHYGHRWQIEALRRNGADYVVAVMSGHYVQRGEPALLPKEVRSRAAVLGGADLVLELPSVYALRSARDFGGAAVGLLLDFGANLLAFGCETPDLRLLWHTAKVLAEEQWLDAARGYLAAGETFAAAREKAVRETGDAATAALLRLPNNLLGVEYLRALLLRGRQNAVGEQVRVLPLPRVGVGHDSGDTVFLALDGLSRADTVDAMHIKVTEDTVCMDNVAGAESMAGKRGAARQGFASASRLREMARTKGISTISPFVPKEALTLYLQCEKERGGCASVSYLERAVLARLRQIPPEGFLRFADCGEGLEHRLYRGIGEAASLEELYRRVKTKRYTLSRIRRLCWNAALGFDRNAAPVSPPYLRILALGKRGGRLLSAVGPQLPVSGSLKKLVDMGGDCGRAARGESEAGDLYGLAFPDPLPRGFDYRLRLG